MAAPTPERFPEACSAHEHCWQQTPVPAPGADSRPIQQLDRILCSSVDKLLLRIGRQGKGRWERKTRDRMFIRSTLEKAHFHRSRIMEAIYASAPRWDGAHDALYVPQPPPPAYGPQHGPEQQLYDPAGAPSWAMPPAEEEEGRDLEHGDPARPFAASAEIRTAHLGMSPQRHVDLSQPMFSKAPPQPAQGPGEGLVCRPADLPKSLAPPDAERSEGERGPCAPENRRRRPRDSGVGLEDETPPPQAGKENAKQAANAGARLPPKKRARPPPVSEEEAREA